MNDDDGMNTRWGERGLTAEVWKKEGNREVGSGVGVQFSGLGLTQCCPVNKQTEMEGTSWRLCVGFTDCFCSLLGERGSVLCVGGKSCSLSVCLSACMSISFF